MKKTIHYRSILYKAEKLKRGKSPLLQSINFSPEFSKSTINLDINASTLLELTIN